MMITLKRAHIIENAEYSKKVDDLGARIQFMQIPHGDAYIEAIRDGKEPHDLYFLKESVEWLLSQ
jgi:hypothetical protein